MLLAAYQAIVLAAVFTNGTFGVNELAIILFSHFNSSLTTANPSETVPSKCKPLLKSKNKELNTFNLVALLNLAALSYNPFKGSHVILFNFSEDLKPLPKSERKPKNEPLIELVSEQALNKSCTSSETGTEQAVVPSINYINNTNILNDKNVSNLEKQAKNFEEINNSDLKNEIEEMQSAFADTKKKTN